VDAIRSPLDLAHRGSRSDQRGSEAENQRPPEPLAALSEPCSNAWVMSRPAGGARCSRSYREKVGEGLVVEEGGDRNDRDRGRQQRENELNARAREWLKPSAYRKRRNERSNSERSPRPAWP
jgi:hypothetical protein